MADTVFIGTNPSPKPPSRRRIRWWPVAIILVLAAGAIFYFRTLYGRSRQDQNIATASVVIIAIPLLLLWCLLFSRIRWRIRLGIFGVAVGFVALLPLLFRIHGVTGDLVPVLEWRWQSRNLPSLEKSAKTASSGSPTQANQFTNDYPQFLGPHRNSTVDQSRLARDWNAQPPKRLWDHPVGIAWSGFAVSGNRAVTQEQRGDNEAVVCYELLSGAVLWSYAYPAHFESSLAGEGPRATPTVAGGKAYALGATGILNCLDLETGKAIWSKDIVQDNQSETNSWGISCSPLVMGDLVVISAGGRNERSLVAYRAATGEFVWGGGNNGAGYSSPLLTTLAGVSQILNFNGGGVCSHAASSGKVLWKYPWPGGHPHVSTPVVLPDDRVLISSGYGTGSELVKVKKDADGIFATTRLWKSVRLKAKFTNLVYRDGFIYGLDDGIMVCLDANTGQLKWKEGRYGHGQEILAGDVLLVMAESGEVVLLEPNPTQPHELTRFSALNQKTWNPPALAGEFLLVRNDKEAACYRLPLVKP
jgi:outer membrane protein assembly factor BamB